MQRKKGWRHWVQTGALTTVLTALVAATAPGCLDRPVEPVEPRTTTTIVERLTQSAVDKIDLLLVIDNSRSMADKQQILRVAVPDLINELINPACVDEMTGDETSQPGSPLEACPDGTVREFDPILDIHIGVITSSLGGHGSDSCTGEGEASENDQAHLITREQTGSMPGNVPTYQDLGFLVWDPDTENPTHDPQGETDSTVLIENLGKLVAGAGEVGCGYEATLEAWRRFLVDPKPYQNITIEGGSAVLEGVDETLLEQRKQFLRPDSLLAIIMLSDENDCSIRDGGQAYFAAQRFQPGSTNQYHLPKPTSECADDPNDPCCVSCGQNDGKGPDGDCPTEGDDCLDSNGNVKTVPAGDDHINLRCYDQKRRFGINFLYPIQRYVKALTNPEVADRNGEPQRNPLFSDLKPNDDNSAVRDSGLVFLAGIVGVPWQDIARKDADGNPDLLDGCDGPCEDDDGDGEVDNDVGGFQSASELESNGTWDLILGDPSCYATDSSCLPEDPLMIESVTTRSGSNPVTGDQVVDASNPLGNNINGHDYSVPQKNDLQYACIFDLQQEKDCNPDTGDPPASCDCDDPNNDNPLCYDGSAFTETQFRAKAYPGIRELQVLKNVGSQGIVGSICPQQQSDDTLFNFGYRPAIGAIVERLKLALSGQCLGRSLTPNQDGQVPCLIIEARTVNEGQCDSACSANGRRTIDQSHPAVEAAKEDELAEVAGWNCFCEITQLVGEDLDACQQETDENPTNASGESVHGWCYVDAATVPPTGNPELVEDCPATEQRIIRFVGEGQGASGATLFITCAGE